VMTWQPLPHIPALSIPLDDFFRRAVRKGSSVELLLCCRARTCADDRAGPTHLNTEVTAATEATTAPRRFPSRSCTTAW
jgi:hypothetical protein